MTKPIDIQQVFAGDSEMLELIRQMNLKLKESSQSEEDKVKELLQKSSSGSVKLSLTNLRTILESHKVTCDALGFNEFTEEVTVNKEPITDDILNEIRMMVDQEYAITYTKDSVMDVVRKMARDKNSYHPIKQMIESYPWDQTCRMDSVFIDYLGAEDNEYIREVTRKWLVGAVARIYQPGIKFEMVPVLVGSQGKGKSTLAAKLGGDYFVDSLSSMGNTKDDYQLLIQSWIIELGELSSMRKTDTDKIKNFISATSDKVRLPYSKTPTNNKRTCVFIGTTNNSQFLQDLTGNRRFFPVVLENKPKKKVFDMKECIIQQIWAEAFAAYKNKEDLYPSSKMEEEANKHRSVAVEDDLAIMDIDLFLDMPVSRYWDQKDLYKKKLSFEDYLHSSKIDPDGNQIKKTTTAEIARVVFNVKSSDRTNGIMKRINLFMNSKNDWKKQTVWINGKAQSGYARIE